MAAHLHGPPPGNQIYANSWRVLRQAMLWAGVLDDQIDATHGQEDQPVVYDWYHTLIEMTRRVPESATLLTGAGNLDLPARPAFTGCALTELGRTVAEQLFAAHPQYHA
jgi:hypothetical protein